MASPPPVHPDHLPDTPPSPAPESVSPVELLTTWQAWNTRDLLTHALTHARSAGDTNRAKAVFQALNTMAVIEPLDALAANYTLVRMLLARQPQALRAARHAGASWQQIAAAAGTTAEQACADYLAHSQHTQPRTGTQAPRSAPGSDERTDEPSRR